MTELGIDVAHVEGLFAEDRLVVFDINPYPTAHGNSLTRITAAMVDRIAGELLDDKGVQP